MSSSPADIAQGLERLRLRTKSDFAGLGQVDGETRKLRWRFAAGSVNERTRSIAQKPTAGLSGAALRSGRPARMEDGHGESARLRLEEPVMLAERLASAAAIPIAEGTGGVLLLGRRDGRGYETAEMQQALSETEAFRAAFLEPIRPR